MKICNYIKHLILGITALGLFQSAFAQSVKSTYFLNNSYQRIDLNPALQPSRGYLSIGLGNTAFDLSTGNFSLGRLIFFEENGSPNWVLNDPTQKSKFLGTLSDKNPVSTSSSLQPFGLGFYTGKIFWNLNVSVREQASIVFPKSMFEMVANGSGNYSLKDLSFENISYGEIGLGASFPIGDKLTVGGKLKYLVGLAYMDVKFSKFDMQMNSNKWDVAIDGKIKSAISNGYQVPVGEKFDFDNYFDDMNSITDNLKSRGLAVDLGATYKLLDNLTLSFALTNLGSINWKKENNTFAEINNYKATLLDINKNLEDLKDDLDNQPEIEAISVTPENFKTKLASTMNAGAEYSVLKDKISFGILYSNRSGVNSSSSVTFASNFKPLRAFNTALTYTMASHKVNAVGAAINWTPGWFFNMFAATDFIFTKVTPEYIPVNARQANIQFGFSIPLGSRKKNPAKINSSQTTPMVTPNQDVKIATDTLVPVNQDSLQQISKPDSIKPIQTDSLRNDSIQQPDSILTIKKDSVLKSDSMPAINADSIPVLKSETTTTENTPIPAQQVISQSPLKNKQTIARKSNTKAAVLPKKKPLLRKTK